VKTLTEETITIGSGDPIRFLTPSKYTSQHGHVAECVLITVREGAVNYAYGDVNIDLSATGHQAVKGQVINIEGSYIVQKFRFKAVVPSVLFVTYENTVAMTATQ
jgi:hypothetical protein